MYVGFVGGDEDQTSYFIYTKKIGKKKQEQKEMQVRRSCFLWKNTDVGLVCK